MRKLIIAFFLLFSFSATYVSANEWGGDGSNENWIIDENGQFTYWTETGKWQGGNRYQTEALVMHRYARANGEPLTGTAGVDYIIVPVYPKSTENKTTNPVDKGTNTLKELLKEDENVTGSKAGRYRAGASCVDTTVDSNTIRTDCTIAAEIVNQFMYQIFGDNLRQSNNFYVSHIFQVTGSNGQLKAPFIDIHNTPDWNSLIKTRTAMQNAAPWGPKTTEAIPEYYNRLMVYKPSNYLIRVWVDKDYSLDPNPLSFNFDTLSQMVNNIREVPGVLRVEAWNPDENFELSNDFKIPVFTDLNIPIDKVYVRGGVDWDLTSSWYWHSRDPSGDKRAEAGPSVLNRNIKMPAGVTLVVAEYEQKGEEICTVNCGNSDAVCSVSLAQTITSPASYMDPNATGVLQADAKGNPKFNINQGIPASEKLYSDNKAKPFLLNYVFERYDGECTHEVEVTKNYRLTWTETGSCNNWDDDWNCIGWDTYPRSDDVAVKTTVVEKQNFSFWTVKDLGLYRLNTAEISSGALPGGKVAISASGNSVTGSMNVEANKDRHYQVFKINPIQLTSGTKSGGSSRPTTPAESEIRSEAVSAVRGQLKPVKVKNDSVTIMGTEIMNSDFVDDNTAAPKSPPVATANFDLYKSANTIPVSVKDGVYPSEGSARYTRVLYRDTSTNPSLRAYPFDVNSVRVHTPVVNYSSIDNSNRAYNQYWGNNSSSNIGVLGRDLTINFNNQGQHLNILGYGNRDYSDYTGVKRIRFSFPVYVGNTYYSANSWISVGPSAITVRIPEWADEGSHTIRAESWAVNAQDMTSAGSNFNGTLGQEGASRVHNLHLVGRMYGFTVYDIGDFRYETVFRTSKGSSSWTGFKYNSGVANQNGQANEAAGNAQLALPVRPGSHPREIATTPHNGYPFSFYFTTVGQYWQNGARMEIVPTFYFVPKSGGNAVEVDLYYNTPNAKLIKVGSSNDNGFKRTIQMNDPYRSVDQTLMRETLGYEYDHLVSSATPKNTYIENALKRKIQISTGYKKLTLDYRTRTLIGQVDSNASANQFTQRASRQRWFGEFSLPIDPFILDAGTNIEELARTKYKGSLTGKEAEFKTGGYIIVNFQIYAYKAGSSTPYIAYDSSSVGNANMWSIEKQIQSSTSYLGSNFNYRFGDVIMFESDFSVKDDYKS